MVTLIRPTNSKEIAAGLKKSISSVSDIGRSLNGRRVTVEQFLAYERLMTNAVVNFLFNGEQEVAIGRMEVDKRSFLESRKLMRDFALDKVLLRVAPPLTSDIGPLEAQDLTRLALRECAWLEFIAGKRSVHFGYDLYVYFKGGRLPKRVVEEFQKMGFKVEARKTLPLGHRNSN